MEAPSEPWALVLAAGAGNRLRALTTDRRGNSIPKQFCSLNGGASLLRLALQRAGRIAPRERITTIVAVQHERWWRAELSSLPEPNVIVQPLNRGTAVGVLMPLLCILARDPEGRIVIFPSDHFVAEEQVLERALHEALAEVDRRPERVVLIGIVPDEPDSEFGWIVPADAGARGVQGVERFAEKPPAPVAIELMRRGGVWNSFILATRGRTLLELFDLRLPQLVTSMWGAAVGELDAERRLEALARVYAELETIDFCRDLLQGHEQRLSVLPVPHCGWTDLGTPARVARCLERLPQSTSSGARASSAALARLDLAQISLRQATRATPRASGAARR